MGRDGGQCVVHVSCERDGVGSSIFSDLHGSERGESTYPVRTAPHNEAVHPPIKAQSQLVVHARMTTTVDEYRRITVRF